MKVALNPAELRLIVDALDDKRQFQCFSCKVSGRAEQEARLENPPSLAEAEAI